jgi:hypothetical protein
MKKKNYMVQLNVRVPAAMKELVKLVADETDSSIEEIIQDAFALHCGWADDLVKARRKRCLAAIKRLDAKTKSPG